MAYLDTSKIFSYNSALAFIILKRGIGKSFGFKMKCIKNFIDGRGKFIWVRRTKPETKAARDKWVNDIIEKFPNHALTIKNYTCYCNGEPCGYFVSLSTTIGQKSVPYNDVSMLVYDECIIESKGMFHYLPDEPAIFSSFLMSVFRDRPMKAFCLGNKGEKISPYNIYFNLPPFDRNEYISDRKILVFANYRDGIVEDNYQDSDIEKVLKGTNYYEYSLMNAAHSGNEHYIKKRPNSAKQMYIINMEGTDIGVFYDFEDSRIYFDRKCDKTDKNKYCFRATNLQESYFLISKQLPQIKILHELIAIGRVFYADLMTKEICSDFVKYIC